LRNYKRVIVEGMDGGGKTTLIEHLMEKSGPFELIVNTLGPEQDFNIWWPRQFDRRDPIAALHDRFFYSELVYGPILRGSITADATLISNGLWFLRTSALLIYARPHSETLRRFINKRPQMEGVKSHFDELLKLYDELMAAEKTWYGDRFIHFDWTKGGAEEKVTDQVNEYLAHV
jgi:thymidylate kinase